DHHDARVRYLLLLQRAHGRDRREDCIAIIRAAAPVELSVAPDRRPRSEAGIPAFEGRLFVEMAVHEDRRGGITVDLYEEQRRSSFNRMDLGTQTVDL